MSILESIIRIFIMFQATFGYNLDTHFPIIYSGKEGDFFGFTTALHRAKDGYFVLVGSPKSNSSVLRDIKEPGVIFNCKIDEAEKSRNCSEIVFETQGNVEGKNAEGVRYKSWKHGMWLGASLDVRQTSQQRDIVACGHLWKDQLVIPTRIYGHRPNGICYVIDENFDSNSVKLLMPLVDPEKQNIGDYFYAAGQAGISATYSEDGDHLFIGTPGLVYWEGGITRYFPAANYISPDVLRPLSDLSIENYSLLGYSVTSGAFFTNNEDVIFVAAGAPRANKYKGKVYIVKMRKSRQRILSIADTKDGHQLGEYFGYSVLGINLNGDNFTDLLVGAPMNSADSTHIDRRGDEGKVYVYLSNGVVLEKPKELTGGYIPNSRFGTSLGNIGDINQDGFNDVAVGAPEENGKGAVYIYHGSRTGIKTEYVQKIFASDVDNGLSGFGISISRSMDVDNNKYPDIVIGSHYSSNAVLLRTHPVVKTQATITTNPKQINANVYSCDVRGETLACVNVTACLWITGPHALKSTNFQSEISIESSSSFGVEDRGFFVAEGKPGFSWKEQQKLEFEKTNCVTNVLHIYPGIKDIISPITVLYRYEIGPYPKDKFRKYVPVLDDDSSSEISAMIPFQTGCGKDEKCHSDLRVEARIVRKESDEKFLIGKDSTLLLKITVSNDGEPAYLSELFIYLPEHIDTISQELCMTSDKHVNNTLVCDLGNPLKKEAPVTFHVKLDISKVPTYIKELEILSAAQTISEDVNPSNDKSRISLLFRAAASIVLLGLSLQEQVVYNEVNTSDHSMVISHTFMIRNQGPSPVEMVYFHLQVPVAFLKNGKRYIFTELITMQTADGTKMSVPATCSDTFIDTSLKFGARNKRGKRFANLDVLIPATTDVNSLALGQTEKINKEMKVIDCDAEDVECETIQCSASPFKDTRGVAQITMTAQLNMSVLNEYLKPWFVAKFVSSGEIFMRDGGIDQKTVSDKSQVETVIVNESPMQQAEVAWWIIIVSIVVGILLLILILVALVRCGFFKRKEKQRMEFMKKALEGQQNPEFKDDEQKTEDCAAEDSALTEQ